MFEWMAKKKVYPSLDCELVEWVDGQVKTGRYSGRTHAIEVALKILKEFEEVDHRVIKWVEGMVDGETIKSLGHAIDLGLLMLKEAYDE